MQYYVRIKDDPAKRRWGVRQARSLKHALDAIAHAQVTGSIGHTDTITEYPVDGPPTGYTLASVIEVNSDNTERNPYMVRY